MKCETNMLNLRISMTPEEYAALYIWERDYDDKEENYSSHITDFLEKENEGVESIDWGMYEGNFLFFSCETKDQAEKFTSFIESALKPHLEKFIKDGSFKGQNDRKAAHIRAWHAGETTNHKSQ